MPSQDDEVDLAADHVPDPYGSEPSSADRAADQRDVAASARDEAAAVRDSVSALASGSPSASDRLFASADRHGGDEFVCGLTNASLAETERRFAAVSDALALAVPGASVSVGLAALQQQEDLASLIDRADHAMYERRRTRRG